MVPHHSRPRPSHFPSLKRLSGLSSSTVASTLVVIPACNGQKTPHLAIILVNVKVVHNHPGKKIVHPYEDQEFTCTGYQHHLFADAWLYTSTYSKNRPSPLLPLVEVGARV